MSKTFQKLRQSPFHGAWQALFRPLAATSSSVPDPASDCRLLTPVTSSAKGPETLENDKMRDLGSTLGAGTLWAHFHGAQSTPDAGFWAQPLEWTATMAGR